MDDSGRTSNIPVIDLTNDNGPNRNRAIRYFDHAKNGGRDTNHSSQNNLTGRSAYCYSSTPVIDLTRDNEQFLNRIPVIDLTDDHDHFLNNGIPIIDLTDDHVQDIAKQMQSIDLTNDGASSFNLNEQYFDFSSNGDKCSNTSKEIIDLTVVDNQDFNTNTPVVDLTDDDNQDIISNRPVVDLTNNHHQDFNINEPVDDLTSENDQFGSYRVPDGDMVNDDTQDITRQFQNIDLTHGKQQNVHDIILEIEVAADNDQSIDQNITGVNISCYKDYNNVRRSVMDLTRNEVNIRNSDDVEIHDDEAVDINILSANLQDTISENLPVNFREDVTTESNVLKCNEALNMNLMHVGTFCRMQQHYCRKETTQPNTPLSNNFEDKNSSPRRSEKISHNAASDFLKPAHRPIPLRHSLGRSTVNTSKHIPIEYIEDSEGQFHALTASSVIRRKKSKSSEVTSKENLPNSSVPSTSKENILSSNTFTEFFLKLWNFVFYWIFKIIMRFIEFFDN